MGGRQMAQMCRFFAVAVVSVAVMSSTAYADAIDGDWCFQTQSLTIRGPTLRTPGGSEITGTYERHSFAYSVPANEPSAGSPVSMQLMGEEMMHVVRGTDSSTPEIWRRCKPVS